MVLKIMVSPSYQTKNSMDTPEPLKKCPYLLLCKGVLMLSLPGYFKQSIPMPVNGFQVWKKNIFKKMHRNLDLTKTVEHILIISYCKI
jgi:hypothetical protein